MKLTKYEHACFTVEKDGTLLVVDPGGWTTDLPKLDNVTAIVVTHEHPDHYDVDALNALIARNPNSVVYAHKDIISQLSDVLPSQAVAAGETVKTGVFMIEFFGGKHATIHPDLELVANLGVMINDAIYYPGDSFTEPGKAVDVLALPVVAPWMRLSEALDFVKSVKPRHVFPTHDAIASDNGKALFDRMVPIFAEQVGSTYQRLSGPLEIDG